MDSFESPEDRPVFKWQKLPGATTYRVYVGDARGHEAATSVELSPDTSEWTPSNRLKIDECLSARNCRAQRPIECMWVMQEGMKQPLASSCRLTPRNGLLRIA